MAVTVSVAIAAALVITALNLARAAGSREAGASTVPGPASTAPDATAPAAAERSPTPAVSPDQLAQGVQMFLNAMGHEFKSWMWRIGDLQYGATSGEQYQAPLLGAWWALADWCHDRGRGKIGECYDYSANYVHHWFSCDPRQVNSRTWTGGAIGSLIFDGYDTTGSFLGIATSSTGGIMKERPGIDILCTPSCATRLDTS